MAGALISYLIGRKDKKARDYAADFVTIAEFALAVWLFAGVFQGKEYEFVLEGIFGQGLYLKLDGFRAVYSVIAGLMWMMTTIFSREYLAHYRNRNRYYLFTLLTLGATVGVFLSADLFTTFIFFEIMSFTSYVMVVHDEKREALDAGNTYIAVAVIGGMVMLMGLFLLCHQTGTLQMDLLREAAAGADRRVLYVAGGLILFGFGAKAGMFPLHIWLPKAHPVAPAPASALLSGILTKAGVFGILVISSTIFLQDAYWGLAIVCLGVITMFLGALLAVFSVNLKRTLACSSMSQIGFILVAVGMAGILGHHGGTAAWGAVLHMVNHSLIKLVLFMAAGVVYQNLHKLDLNEIRGFGRKKPLLMFAFLMGVLGIIGMPFWNGYISKTLIHESIVEYIWTFKEYGFMARLFQIFEGIFTFTGGLTAAYMLKLFIAVFLEKNPYHQAEMDASNGHYMNRESTFALVGSALLLPVLGMFPYQVTNRIAAMSQGILGSEGPAETVRYFSWSSMKGAAASLAIGVIVYLLFIRVCLMKTDEQGNRVYRNAWPSWLDLEKLIYRPVLFRAVPFLCAFLFRGLSEFPDTVMALLHKTVLRKKAIPKTDPAALEADDMLYHGRQHITEETITNSLSFGLLLFGTGLCAALIYMIYLLL